MSDGPAPLEPIYPKDWLSEPHCGLPAEPPEGHGLAGLLPVVSQWKQSSAATWTGKLSDALLGGGIGILLGKLLGFPFSPLAGLIGLKSIPGVGSIADKALSKLLGTTGLKFSFKDTVTLGVRSTVMALENGITDRRAGEARLKAQGQLGQLGSLGQGVFGGGAQ